MSFAIGVTVPDDVSGFCDETRIIIRIGRAPFHNINNISYDPGLRPYSGLGLLLGTQACVSPARGSHLRLLQLHRERTPRIRLERI